MQDGGDQADGWWFALAPGLAKPAMLIALLLLGLGVLVGLLAYLWLRGG